MDKNTSQPNNEKDIKNLRTYTSDMADVIRTNEVSVIKIALAEKEKREQEQIYKEAEGTNTSKTFLIIGGVVLIAAAIFGSYFLIKTKIAKDTPKNIVKEIDTFIAYDSFSNIDTTSIKDADGILNLIIGSQPLGSGLIRALFPKKITNNISELITSKNFLSSIGVNPPSALTRSMSDKYLLGKFTNRSGGSSIFLVFQTTDYNLAYASMLDWEKTLLKDLYKLFNISIPDSNSILFSQPWKDIVVNNKDARVLYGESGEAVLYYVFVNKNNFVITNNIETLKEIISRLITKNAQVL
jgi:hypothetical protein